jgi:glycosyltransferase involved in cell wall biosynthesis
MKILWFTWKDMNNPLAGGAEVVNEELAKRLVKSGHEVTFIVGGFRGGEKETSRDGFKIIRLGNRWTVYIKAFFYYKNFLSNWPDLVIEEINTIPFFTKYFVSQKSFLVIHQLAREVWFYQMVFPISLIGYILEPIYLWLLRDRKVVTVSNSTKSDLIKYGFNPNNISIISEGVEISPIENISPLTKFDKKTVLSLGSIRPMKRTDHIVKAFEIAKSKIPELQLVVAGDYSGSYGQKVFSLIKQSKYKDSITLFGKVDQAKKIELLQKSHVLLVTSIKEGWGLVVTEANSQGAPAIVYNVDGLRDSVLDKSTGLVCDENTPENMAKKITELFFDQNSYKEISKNALEFSKGVSFEKSFSQFIKIINE